MTRNRSASSTSPELAVAATIERFWDGWRHLDIAAVLSTMAPDDRLTFIGTDRAEYWRGYATLVSVFRAMGDAFIEESVAWSDGDPRINIRGDVAWADGSLAIGVTLADASSIRSDCRATFVLVADRDAWSIVQAHISVAPDNPVAAY